MHNLKILPSANENKHLPSALAFVGQSDNVHDKPFHVRRQALWSPRVNLTSFQTTSSNVIELQFCNTAQTDLKKGVS